MRHRPLSEGGGCDIQRHRMEAGRNGMEAGRNWVERDGTGWKWKWHRPPSDGRVGVQSLGNGGPQGVAYATSGPGSSIPCHPSKAGAPEGGGIFGNRVTHMAETETDIAKMAPDALVTEIEHTRTELARTIDEIADRVSPAKVAQRTAGQVRARISQVDPLIGGAVALAGVSVACYFIWRRLRK